MIAFATIGSFKTKPLPMYKQLGYPSKKIMDWDIISLRCLKEVLGV